MANGLEESSPACNTITPRLPGGQLANSHSHHQVDGKRLEESSPACNTITPRLPGGQLANSHSHHQVEGKRLEESSPACNTITPRLPGGQLANSHSHHRMSAAPHSGRDSCAQIGRRVPVNHDWLAMEAELPTIIHGFPLPGDPYIANDCQTDPIQ